MMANNQNHQLNTDEIRDLLSPYLDGEVTDEERVQVEQALAGSVELQRELETLRRTIALVATLPPISAPRPFTLTEADVKPSRPTRANFFGLPSWFTGVAALAATLLCVLVAGGFFLSRQFSSSQQAAEVANAPVMSTAAEAPAQEEADQVESAAREQSIQTAEATAEAMVEAAEEETTMAAAAAELPAAAQEAAPADESMAAESQAITQAYEAVPAEQPAVADAAAPELAATASPAPTTLALVAPEPTTTPSPLPIVVATSAPAEEAPQEKAAAGGEAEAGQMAAESAPAPTEAAIQENDAESADVQTDQITVESTPAPESLELEQSAPTVTPSSPPSAPPVAVLTLPVPETPTATATPVSLIESDPTNWGLTIGIAVAGLLVIVGGIIWLVSRGQKRAP